MIQKETDLVVADNSGARRIRCFTILGQRRRAAHVGDLIKCSIKEAQPNGLVKKGQVCTAMIVRTKHPIRRSDGTFVRFDDNAAVLVDAQNNPLGSRVFGPVARELRQRQAMKILSLAPEVL